MRVPGRTCKRYAEALLRRKKNLTSRMNLPLIIMVICLVRWTSADSCPEEYMKFSANHTACLPVNTNCHFLQMGVSYEDAGEILDIHNSLRSKVATGRESRGGGMPEASNMLQMEWDNELARLAQNEAEQCEVIRNCPACRAVENFPVGQVVEYRQTDCLENSCSRLKPSWKDIIESIYNGIDKYDSSKVGSQLGDATTQFTQLIWADTWRVGCGYASYLQDNIARHTYICNYGPRENLRAQPIYQQGPACTACPSNTCCGSQCNSISESPVQGFEGLCKMISPNIAPVYLDMEDFVFYCDFDEEQNPYDCDIDFVGVNKWKIKETLMGNIISIRLSEGEESVLRFLEPIIPESDICVQFQFRQGPATAGVTNSARVLLKVDAKTVLEEHSLSYFGNHFNDFHVHIPAYNSLHLSIEYKVRKGSPDSILDIRHVAIFDGRCSEDDEDDEEEDEEDERR